MMEAVLFLLFVVACQGLPLDTAPQLLLPIPVFKRFETVDDPNNITAHEIVEWYEVGSDASNPILGYKLKVWEIQKIRATKYKKEGDEVVRVLEETYPPININAIPDGVPKEIITSANETTATFRDMYEDMVYQFAVQAFTAEGDGPLSLPVRIRLLPKGQVATNDDDLHGKTEIKYK